MPKEGQTDPKARLDAPKKGRPSISVLVEKIVVELAVQGLNASNIVQRMQEPDVVKRLRDAGVSPPALRTVQRLVQSYRRPAGTEWTLSASAPEDAALVLAAQAALARNAPSGFVRFTVQEAEWFIRLSKIAPSLDLDSKWKLTRLYLLRGERKETTNDLDAWLGAAPWLSEEQEQDYDVQVRLGYLPAPPPVLRRIDDWARMTANPSVEHWNKAWANNSRTFQEEQDS